MSCVELVVSKVRDARPQSGGWYLAKCPAHEDRAASLSIKSGSDGRALLNCFAGCGFGAIVAALGVRPSDLFPPRDRRQEAAWAARRSSLRRRFRNAPQRVKAKIFRELLEVELARERADVEFGAPMRSRHVNAARKRVADELGITIEPIPPYVWESAGHDHDPAWPFWFEHALKQVAADPRAPSRHELLDAEDLAWKLLREEGAQS